MDQNDRHAIEGLFGKLSKVERQAGPRDGEAEGFIRERIAAQPGAPYFMAQTIVVQEQALDSAQRRIEELEYELASRPQQAASSGGLLSSLFGGSTRPAPQASPRRPAPPAGIGGPTSAPAPAPSGPWGQQPAFGQQSARPAGGGFLAGAAQTAMGVAGGVLLGNAIAGMFAGDTANAAPQPAAEPAPAEEEADAGDEGMDDMEF